ncbi:hypothetical protein [Methylosinus sp. C49]|uniref:hypothetical protein n=1 Tax=Methylosinus sp. C49 TaxID=2699395 RepID=UPI00137991C0|nr:hypothetical protein [Methylosinus sp. C49]
MKGSGVDRSYAELLVEAHHRLRHARVLDGPIYATSSTSAFLRLRSKCACGRPATRVTIDETRDPTLMMNRRL